MLLNCLSLHSGFASHARVTCRRSCIHYLIKERDTENSLNNAHNTVTGGGGGWRGPSPQEAAGRPRASAWAQAWAAASGRDGPG